LPEKSPEGNLVAGVVGVDFGAGVALPDVGVEGVAGVEEIDTVMKLGMAHPMGPLQLADFIGLDTCLSIMRVLHDGFGNPKYAPCPLLVNMVVSGNLGVKSGQGFYKYTKGSKETVVADNFKK
jgi:3-hydroxybutyryl-CoA dehydrogenase